MAINVADDETRVKSNNGLSRCIGAEVMISHYAQMGFIKTEQNTGEQTRHRPKDICVPSTVNVLYYIM